MTEKRIIGITGLPASGKGAAAQYLKDKYQAVTFRYSTILRDVMDRLYLPHTRENLSGISTVLREFFGQDLLAKVIAQDVEKSPASLVVVEGIRRLEDIKYLKEVAGFTLVGIDADMKLRFERIKQRGENEDDKNKTWEEFVAEHQLETELTILDTMKIADITMDNNGDLPGLYEQLDKLIKN